ncbi:MAG: putative membrane protein [Polaribacter sp.]|jgi:uncharacterized membrane protein
MVCCVFQATNLVNNYQPRKSARTFANRQEASNKLYTVLCAGFTSRTLIYSLVSFRLVVYFFHTIDRNYSYHQ